MKTIPCLYVLLTSLLLQSIANSASRWPNDGNWSYDAWNSNGTRITLERQQLRNRTNIYQTTVLFSGSSTSAVLRRQFLGPGATTFFRLKGEEVTWESGRPSETNLLGYDRNDRELWRGQYAQGARTIHWPETGEKFAWKSGCNAMVKWNTNSLPASCDNNSDREKYAFIGTYCDLEDMSCWFAVTEGTLAPGETQIVSFPKQLVSQLQIIGMESCKYCALEGVQPCELATKQKNGLQNQHQTVSLSPSSSGVQISGLGIPGYTMVIESTSDLVSWSEVGRAEVDQEMDWKFHLEGMSNAAFFRIWETNVFPNRVLGFEDF